MKDEGSAEEEMSSQKRGPIKSFRDLEVYRRARAVNIKLHDLVLNFPEFEKYGLTDQIRRSSKSIMANIAEGYAVRESVRDFKRYLRMALGSANETEAHVEIANDLGYITIDVANALTDELQIIARQLNRLMAAWRSFS